MIFKIKMNKKMMGQINNKIQMMIMIYLMNMIIKQKKMFRKNRKKKKFKFELFNKYIKKFN